MLKREFLKLLAAIGLGAKGLLPGDTDTVVVKAKARITESAKSGEGDSETTCTRTFFVFMPSEGMDPRAEFGKLMQGGEEHPRREDWFSHRFTVQARITSFVWRVRVDYSPLGRPIGEPDILDTTGPYDRLGNTVVPKRGD